MIQVDPRSWAAPRPSGLRRLVPILTWLPAYDRSFIRFDLIAGATVWGLLVPEMIAYAGLAVLPPQAGLYTLLVALAAYAIFGTSRHVVVAGTSAAAVLLASAVVLDFGPNATLDITSSESLDELVTALRSAGIDFALAEVRRPVRDAARGSGVLATIGEDRVFRTIDEAVGALASASARG